MNRQSCLYCVLKHLAQAQILIIESQQGYPLHGWLAVGHLAQAEAESLESYKELSESINTIRLTIMGDKRGKIEKQGIMKLIEIADNILKSKLNGIKNE